MKTQLEILDEIHGSYIRENGGFDATVNYVIPLKRALQKSKFRLPISVMDLLIKTDTLSLFAAASVFIEIGRALERELAKQTAPDGPLQEELESQTQV